MKISIVTAYYNRRDLFIETLKSIVRTAFDNYEVIAVDDASKETERIEDLVKDFPFLKIIRVESKEKWYCNSGIPFNMGIAKADGDIILLQNPECKHVNDVLAYVSKHTNDSNYITMATYAIGGGWYNHSVYRPAYFHFCSAITKKNMKSLGGFDERFAMGIGYDDNDFVERIDRLGLKKEIVDTVVVIHQQHPKVYDLANPEHQALYDKNAKLHKTTRKETIIKVTNSYE